MLSRGRKYEGTNPVEHNLTKIQKKKNENKNENKSLAFIYYFTLTVENVILILRGVTTIVLCLQY